MQWLGIELSSLRSQLECWNNGMMGLGKWDIEIRTEFALDNEVNKRVSFLQYQHSNIPLFHVRGINIKPQKIHLISISCRISETLN